MPPQPFDIWPELGRVSTNLHAQSRSLHCKFWPTAGLKATNFVVRGHRIAPSRLLGFVSGVRTTYDGPIRKTT
jgi:hypothetical protein